MKIINYKPNYFGTHTKIYNTEYYKNNHMLRVETIELDNKKFSQKKTLFDEKFKEVKSIFIEFTNGVRDKYFRVDGNR